MKNRLSDLNNHLFAQLERLADESLEAEAVAREVSRAEAMVKVSDQILANAKLHLDAARLVAEHGGAVSVPMIETRVKEP